MEELNMSDVIAEVRNANEEELRAVMEENFKQVRNQGIKVGAGYISAAIYGVIKKHIQKKTGAKASLRDYQRCLDEVIGIISVQLTHQNDLKNATGDKNNDGTSE
jgi:hypothetical protein